MVFSLQTDDFQIVSSALDDSILIWDFFTTRMHIDVELSLCILLSNSYDNTWLHKSGSVTSHHLHSVDTESHSLSPITFFVEG